MIQGTCHLRAHESFYGRRGGAFEVLCQRRSHFEERIGHLYFLFAFVAPP